MHGVVYMYRYGGKRGRRRRREGREKERGERWEQNKIQIRKTERERERQRRREKGDNNQKLTQSYGYQKHKAHKKGHRSHSNAFQHKQETRPAPYIATNRKGISSLTFH